MNVGLNVINLFDQDTITRQFQTRHRDSVAGITDAQFFQGFDVFGIAESASWHERRICATSHR